ncbi:MAG: nuclear transport factor 2 family protein [Pseudomonadota bacterium]
MQKSDQTLIDLENKFWQSMVDQDTDTALELLSEPAILVSSYGAFTFDHDGYRKMVEQASMTVKSFELSDVEVVFPNDATAIVTYSVKQKITPKGKSKSVIQEMKDSSTWIQDGERWQCVMHTETPAEAKPVKH